MYAKALVYFKKADPLLWAVIKSTGNPPKLPRRKRGDYFTDLVDTIISQQLSIKAAETIFNRLKTLFKDGKITSLATLRLNDEKIRAAGISYSKIKYIKDLATKVQNREIDLKVLKALTDEEVIAELIKVKGIGRWTAEMFLIFSLNRQDVFSHGDLGLTSAIKKIYKIKKYSQAEVEKIVSIWSPYKSYASLVLWSSLDNK
jgi:DNA-3-methyladenine glycosylase II